MKRTLISCYFTPNEAIDIFETKLGELEDVVRDAEGGVVVGGDFNARAIEWGMPQTNTRGRLILEMAARSGLVVLNVANTPTFRRAGQEGSIPDITLASEHLVQRIQNWRVLEDYSGSDHQYILYKFGERQRNMSREQVFRPKGWNLARLDREVLIEMLRLGNLRVSYEWQQDVSVAKLEAQVGKVMKVISEACDASMPRKKKMLKPGRSLVYWWNEEIAELRRHCLQLRRIAQRSRGREEVLANQRAYKVAKQRLRNSINRSKFTCWKALVEDVDRDPWGLGYRTVNKKLRRPAGQCLMDENEMGNIVNGLFPTHPIRDEEDNHNSSCDVLLFTEQELSLAIAGLKSGKAPGPDGIPVEILKVAVDVCPRLLLDMYNACLKVGVFPRRWKKARLVLLDKGKGLPSCPSSWRPLCLLDTAGKGFEKLPLRRQLSTWE